MPLPRWEWEDPVVPLLEKLRPRLSDWQKDEFEGAYVRYNLKFIQLQEIWRRLSGSILLFEKRSVAMYAITQRRAERPDENEQRVLDEASSAAIPYSLDYDDFFIHSKILLDRTVFFTRYFLPELRDISGVTTSFTAHRKYFLRTKSYPSDPEYASRVRLKTSWYETNLRHYRDEFVTHDKHLIGDGTLHNPGESPRPIRRPAIQVGKVRWNMKWNELLDLKSKYLDIIPVMRGVPDNAFELLDAFDTYSDLMEPNDLKLLNELHMFMGGKMPNLPTVMASILGFLRFFGNHFETKLERSISSPRLKPPAKLQGEE